MTRHIAQLCFLGLLLAIFTVEGVGATQNKLVDTRWNLESFGKNGSESGLISGTSITLQFGGDGRASGSSGCNSYGGTYTVTGDTLTFGQMISTMRACVDPKANEQEQNYLGALRSTNKFSLSDDRLSITYDGDRSTLNFSNSATANTDSDEGDDTDNSPFAMLTAYYNAINKKDYARAYRYWSRPTTTLDLFARGFSNTAAVRFLVDPSMPIEGAAGSMFASVPAVVIARSKTGPDRVFAGCYVLRKSNVESDDPTIKDWHINKASLTQISSIAQLSKQTCKD